jgi:chromate transporter
LNSENTNQAVDESSDRVQPSSLSDLFWSFSVMALQGFGGVFAVAQREMVDRKRWLTSAQFMGDFSVAQVLPGPNMVNLALMLGDRCFGLRGAFAALAGMMFFPGILILVLAVLFSSFGALPEVQGALRGMGAVVAGLIAASAMKLVGALKENAMGLPVCSAVIAAGFVAVGLLRIPLVWVLVVLGGMAWFWAWRQLGVMKRAGGIA